MSRVFILHSLPEVFGGEEQAMQVEDVDWIAVAARNGWAAMSKNHRISHNVAERTALTDHGVPLFALANGNLNHAEMAGAFVLAKTEITRVLDSKPGGGLWAVSKKGIVHRRWPPRAPVA